MRMKASAHTLFATFWIYGDNITALWVDGTRH